VRNWPQRIKRKIFGGLENNGILRSDFFCEALRRESIPRQFRESGDGDGVGMAPLHRFDCHQPVNLISVYLVNYRSNFVFILTETREDNPFAGLNMAVVLDMPA
jgi:hypothetical protein